MAVYGPDDFAITLGGNAFGLHVDTFDGLSIEAIIEDSHTFGDVWTEQLYSGLRRGQPFTLEGFYDDAANGPDANFAGNEGTTIAIVITWGSSKTSTFSALLQSWTRSPVREGTTRYTATLVPTGAITEA